MLFHTALYIYFFLPVVVIGYFICTRYCRPIIAHTWLLGASLLFYAFWNVSYVPLLFCSVLGNYAIGKVLLALGTQPDKLLLRQYVLWGGIAINIGLLGFYKYADFFISNINVLFKTQWSLLEILLPLAISFYTFQQIAYLVDCYRGNVRVYSLFEYALFILFFPQLIAGPIVHHHELLPQFRDDTKRSVHYRSLALGLFIFSIGLVKKVFIADTFAAWSTLGYAASDTLTFFDAWATTLSYSLQIYFDFSAYTDMAIGSALLFNIHLTQNFNSPYKATSIQDFWRRWHITLSRFLRDYVYIPLGGNRAGAMRMYAAILVTFFLGGLWHGASWTFVVWGVLHGCALVTYQLWKKYSPWQMYTWLGWFMTLLFVHVTWVFFRSEDFKQALTILSRMFDVRAFGIESIFFTESVRFAGKIAFVPEVLLRSTTLWIVFFLGLALWGRNTEELGRRFSPNLLFLLVLIVLYCAGVVYQGGFSEFLYFNF